jgi:hypothetical protein
MFKMITSHLMIVASCSAAPAALCVRESEDRPVTRLGRFLPIGGSRLRKHSPPMR